LGKLPKDVLFTAKTAELVGPYSRIPEGSQAGSLDTFWKSAENFKTVNSGDYGSIWAVSQAAPLRRAEFDGKFSLFDIICAAQGLGEFNSSGGYISNVNVNGTLVFGSQQRLMRIRWWLLEYCF
jgi:hypothetical protein